MSFEARQCVNSLNPLQMTTATPGPFAAPQAWRAAGYGAPPSANHHHHSYSLPRHHTYHQPTTYYAPQVYHQPPAVVPVPVPVPVATYGGRSWYHHRGCTSASLIVGTIFLSIILTALFPPVWPIFLIIGGGLTIGIAIKAIRDCTAPDF